MAADPPAAEQVALRCAVGSRRDRRGWRLTPDSWLLMAALAVAVGVAIFGSRHIQKVVIPIAAAVVAAIVANAASGGMRRGG